MIIIEVAGLVGGFFFGFLGLLLASIVAPAYAVYWTRKNGSAQVAILALSTLTALLMIGFRALIRIYSPTENVGIIPYLTIAALTLLPGVVTSFYYDKRRAHPDKPTSSTKRS